MTDEPRGRFRLRTAMDRAITREVRGAFLLGMSAFTLILTLNQLFILARETIEKRVPLIWMSGLLVAYLPRILVITIPMGFLLGVLVGIGRMATQHEIVALRASGIGPWRLFRPVLTTGLLLMLLGLGLDHYLQPLGKQLSRELARKILATRDLSREIQPGIFYRDLAGTVLYAESAGESPEQGRIFEGILAYQEIPDQDVAALILAKRGRGVFDADSGRVSLLFDEGERHLWQLSEPENYHVVRFQQHAISFPPDARFRALSASRAGDHRDAIGSELWTMLSRLRRQYAETESAALLPRIRKARIEWHRRFAFPASVLIFALLAFPLAARTTRGGRFAGLSQTIGIMFGFWLLAQLGTNLADSNRLPPWLGPWLPHVVSLFWIVLLWRQFLRGTERSGVIVPRIRDALGRLRGSRRRRQRPLNAPGFRRPPLLTRLDSYVTAGHVKFGLAAAIVLGGLAAVIELQKAVGDAVPGTTWGEITYFALLSLPGHLRYVIPIAALVGATVGLSALSRAGELTALRAGGVGPVRIGVPLIAATAAIALVYGFAEETVVPASERESERARAELRGEPVINDVQTGRRWVLGEGRRLWSYLAWDNNANQMQAPWLFVVDLDQARLLERIDAVEATRVGEGWQFADGWRRTLGSESPPRYETFRQHLGLFPETSGLFKDSSTPFFRSTAQMRTIDIWNTLQRMKRSGIPLREYEVGLHQKLAQPLLPILLVLVGVPIVLSNRSRKGSLFGFGMALLIALGFYGLWAATISLGTTGLLTPWLAVWLPPALLAALGLWLFTRTR